MRYILLLVFAASILTGCGTVQKTVEETPEAENAQIEEKSEEKTVKTVKYKQPVVVKEIRKYHSGDIDIYKVYKYEEGWDILISCITYDSANEELDSIKMEKTENTEKYIYLDSNNKITKIKHIKKDNPGNTVEVIMSDSKGNQISKSVYEYTGSLKNKWSIFDSNNVLLAFNKYKYDKNGNNILIESFSPSGNIEESYVNEFDKKGNPVLTLHKDKSGKIIDSIKYIYEDGFIREKSFFKGEKALKRKNSYTYNNDKTFQTCEVTVTGGQVIEIIEKEFFFLEKEKTLIH